MLFDIHGVGKRNQQTRPLSIGDLPSPSAPFRMEVRLKTRRIRRYQQIRGKTLEKSPRSRVRAAAKFFYEGAEKFWLRGVTYGTFEPREGSDYPPQGHVALDFALMREAGVNTVRVYTAPPTYLLDEAARHGLRVIVGLAWTQHVCFLDDARLARQIRAQVERDVRSCAAHPAVLAFAIGNEIPQQIVRWHGAKRIEKFLKQLYTDVKRVAPDKLVTYVNFPPTDYL